MCSSDVSPGWASNKEHRRKCGGAFESIYGDVSKWVWQGSCGRVFELANLQNSVYSALKGMFQVLFSKMICHDVCVSQSFTISILTDLLTLWRICIHSCQSFHQGVATGHGQILSRIIWI